jgi:hypothetical protein
MAGNVISFRTAGSAVLPFAGETEIVGTLATNVVIAEMIVEGLWVAKGLSTVFPKTFMDGLRLLVLVLGLLLRDGRLVFSLLTVIVTASSNGRMCGGRGRRKLGHDLPGMREEKGLVGAMHDCF